jgi:hypothetical protein
MTDGGVFIFGTPGYVMLVGNFGATAATTSSLPSAWPASSSTCVPVGIDWSSKGRYPEPYFGDDLLQPAGLLPLVGQEPQRKVDDFDLAEPSFCFCSCSPGVEILLQFGEPGKHLRVDVQQRAADAGLTEMI